MAKIILKSPYLKPSGKTHLANMVRYIATRDGVEKPDDPKRHLPATKFQRQVVARLLRNYPDTAELYEYNDYQNHPTRENADEFILRAAEVHGELFAGREKYVDYIATRPGAMHVAGHGLFSDAGAPVVLEQTAAEVAAHTGNVWTHIISLRREDAERLGYDSVDAWQALLRGQRNVIAKNMKIKPENFRWFAAFHNATHHPHVHLIACSAVPAEPWLTEDGILAIKSSLARQIFKNDLLETYRRQTEYRDALRQDSRVMAAEMVWQVNTGGYGNPLVEELLLKLAGRLEKLSGKKQYGYLPPDAKATVDRIVDELARDERIATLYDLWYKERQQVVSTYTDKPVKRVPLSQNEDFRPVRNAVIEAAMGVLLEQMTPEEMATDAEEMPGSDDLAPSAGDLGNDTGQVELYTQWSSAHRGVQNDVYLAQTHGSAADTAIASMRLLGRLSQILKEHIDVEALRLGKHGVTESKLQRKIAKKKQAMGLRFGG